MRIQTRRFEPEARKPGKDSRLSRKSAVGVSSRGMVELTLNSARRVQLGSAIQSSGHKKARK